MYKFSKFIVDEHHKDAWITMIRSGYNSMTSLNFQPRIWEVLIVTIFPLITLVSTAAQ